MIEIKVLGPGCANCSKLEQITRKAVTEMGFQADIDKITDYGEIMNYPIISTPGLVINGDLVCSGRVPTQAEVTTWLVNAAQ
ncbi:MAG: thioredoxin family protein [Anaerolineales bacterium]